MPICSKCEKKRQANQFPWRNRKKGIHRGVCSIYSKKTREVWLAKNQSRYLAQIANRRDAWRRELTEKIVCYLEEHPRVNCDFSDPRALEFDHRIPETKTIEISRVLSLGWSWEKTLQEIEKCDVRCANCHRTRTGSTWLCSQVVRRRSAKPET